MKLIDLYILKKFITTFLFVIMIFSLVILVVDYTEKTDDFIKHQLTFQFIIKEYYINYIPFMINKLSPIAVFITVVFVTSRLASHTEIIAILSSGVSFIRLLFPYIIGSSFLAAIIFYMVGWFIPNAAKDKVDFELSYIRNPYHFNQRDIHIKVNDSVYAYIDIYDNKELLGKNFTLEVIKNRELKQKLSAKKIKWNSKLKKWHINKYAIHYFDKEKERIVRSNNMDTLLNFTPKYFESKYHLNETMTFGELDNFIKQQKTRGAADIQTYMVEKHERIAYPFAIIILTIMGVIVSSKKSREGSGFQITFGFLLAFIYILFVIMSRSFAVGGAIDPRISAWIPNITFMIISIIMYNTIPR